MKKIKVTPIPLYKNISGKSLFESDDPLFREYRRRWQSQPLKFEFGDFPLFIDIEVTNSCNLRCPFCATTNLKQRTKGQFIPPEMVHKILDEGKENGLYGAKFNDRGEPLLHPQLIDFVKYAKSCGLVDVYFNTNALLLTEKKIKDLIDAGLNRISISIEGYTADFYERYRVNGKFDVLLKNVRNLWRIRNTKGFKKPLVRIQTVLLPEIQNKFDEYIDRFTKFWQPYADEVAMIEYKEESVAREQKKSLLYPWACAQLWQRMTVRCDGTILPCNEDNLSSLSLGNIKNMSIKTAWHSKQLDFLRNKHRRGEADAIKTCSECFLRKTQIDKLLKLKR